MQKIEVVGAAIMDGGKILAAQRSEIMNAPLKWEFAGGKVEVGETHQQALKREILEELGAGIRVKDFLALGHSLLIDKEIALYVYMAEIAEGVPSLKEHSQLKWIEISELTELDWAEADIPAVNELLKRYK